MQVNYAPFSARMIHRYEGPYGWNKKDRGGPTKWGITCYDLAEERHLKMTSMEAWAPLVKAMTIEEAEKIYSEKYAYGIRFNDLPSGIDCCMFDYGVNSGTSRPIVVARAMLGLPKSIHMDDKLLAALKKVDPKDFCHKMNAERLRFMHAIRGGSAWVEFGHGWQARVDDLAQYCDALIARTPPKEAPDLTKVVQPKAQHEPKSAGTETTSATIGTGVSLKVAGHGWVPTLLAMTAILGAGIAYEIWEQQKAYKANMTVHL